MLHAEGWKKEINLEKKDHRGCWPDVYECKPWNHNKEEDFDEFDLGNSSFDLFVLFDPDEENLKKHNKTNFC